MATPAAAQRTAIIEEGREAEIQALFAPHELADEVRGWRFQSLAVDRQRIRVGVVPPDDLEAPFREAVVVRRGTLKGASIARSESFEVGLVGDVGEAEPALRVLVAALTDNDDGGFWDYADDAPSGRPIDLNPTTFERGLSQVAQSPLRRWARDGLLWCLVLLLWLVVLTARSARALGRQGRAALVLLVVIGAIVRLAFSPDALLGAWPYSRTTDLQRWVFNGPLIELLSYGLGPLYETRVMRSIGLGFATITPLAIFAHGRWLLGSERRGLIAALVVVALPLHLRFSHSEVAFIPSIVFSSVLFASAHLALKDERRRWRVAATVALVPLTAAMMTARPLNVIFVPLVLFVIGRERSVARRHRALLAALVTAPALVLTVTHLFAHFGSNIREGASIDVVVRAARLFFDVERNSLISPWLTPPVVLLAAGGAIAHALRERDSEERPRVAFLLVWLALFFVTHAYVIPKSPAMQARYHLHLVVPLALLAAIGLDAWIGLERPVWLRRFGAPLAFAALALSPVLYSGFIGDLDFNDLREHRFVEAVAARVPEGCTVVEYAGPDNHIDLRMPRAGRAVVAGRQRLRWVSRTELPERPPECLYYYEGLPCRARQSPSAPLAPACVALQRGASWEPVITTRFTSRVYDDNLEPWSEAGEVPLALTLYRAR